MAPLEDVLQGSATFRRAFENQTTGGSLNRVVNVDIIQCSKRCDADACYSAPSGLVSTIVAAYNSHHELVLRPDDVWQAVLTQLSFYIQANAEELRDRFVNFEGKQQLTVYSSGTLFTANFGDMAREMVDSQISQNIKDPSVASWLLPSFTTTTPNDRIVASVSVMATLQAYFAYKFRLCCGIPRVTLQGSPHDWRQLRAKINRLPDYDLGDRRMSEWHALLVPVLDEFVQASEGHRDLKFWDKVCCHVGGGSGPTYLSGWVTVFAVFSTKGEWMASERAGEWPKVDTQDLPAGSVSVPVLVDDNGFEYHTQMIAGQLGFDVVGDDGKAVQPRSDWFIAMPKTDTFCSSAAGPGEHMPLLQQDPEVEDGVEDDASHELQCLLFPELEHPAPTEDAEPAFEQEGVKRA
jgi:hypothetical protein